jgi:hypothetical protein
LKVVLTRDAENQLAALPVPAARRLVETLRLLQVAPRSGMPYPEGSSLQGAWYKTVIVRARRWSYRITYLLERRVLWVLYISPSWYPLTHPGLASPTSPDDVDES